MDKLTSTARKIDVVFKIINIVLTIGIVALLVGLAITAAGAAFNLPDEMIGSADPRLTVGMLTFTIAPDYLPDFRAAYPHMIAIMAAAIALLIPTKMGVRTIREILKPMTEGQPFHGEVSRNLKKLAWLSLIIGLGFQLVGALAVFLSVSAFGLDVLISEKILHVQLDAQFDLTFLVLPALLFLLAYVFKYGEQLQVLSDETL